VLLVNIIKPQLSVTWWHNGQGIGLATKRLWV